MLHTVANTSAQFTEYAFTLIVYPIDAKCQGEYVIIRWFPMDVDLFPKITLTEWWRATVRMS